MNDTSKIWRTIKTLDDSAPSASAPNEALFHNNDYVTSNKGKADIFARHYAKVSSLSFNKQERDEIRSTKKKLHAPGPDPECKLFSMLELKAAIRKMKRKGAPGDDDIPPPFLKELGSKARKELLDICNASFVHADIPRDGFIRDTIVSGPPIVPLEKAEGHDFQKNRVP